MIAEIALLTADDIPEAMALKDALGWNQTPADWQRFVDLAPGGCFKAVAVDRIDGATRLVGTALAFVFDRVCWIGMVIVAEAYRRCGLGAALMRRCLQHSREQGCRLTTLDATPDGEPLYRRLGFRPVGRVGRAVPDQAAPGRSPVRGSGAHLPGGERCALRPVSSADLPAVAALEARAVGAWREPLLRRLLEQRPAPESGLTCRNASGDLQGFVLWRPGRHSLQVGPLIATDPGVAGALLDGALVITRNGGQPPTLTVPAERAELTALLQARGLRVEPRMTRMILPLRRGERDGERLRGEDQLIYAFSGPEKG